MNRLIPLLLFVALLPAVAQETGRGIKVMVRDAAGVEKPLAFYQGSYALLIANSDYTHWGDLAAIPDEMADVKDALVAHGFQIYRGKVLQNLTADEMRTTYHQFIQDHGFDRDNRLVLFYAGHGHTRGAGLGEKGYLVPVDAPLPSQDDLGFARSAVEMTEVDAWMRRIEARHALFLFDSCFSGSIFATRGPQDADVPPYISAAQRDPVRYYITAGSAHEEVPGRSTFTPAFVDALQRGAADADQDGYTLGSELAQYLRKIVATYAGNTVHRGTVKDFRLSQGDLVFVTKLIPPVSSVPMPVTPATATKERPFVNSLGMKFVPVPGTDVLFCIWETRVQDYAAYAAANPGIDMEWKDVEVDGEKQGPDHPVVNVSWEDAQAFCEWLSKKEGVKYRLPTDHEWSVAVGIGDREDRSASPKDKSGAIADVYPWGSAWPPPDRAGNYSDVLYTDLMSAIQKRNGQEYEDQHRFTAPVGSYSSNGSGLFDLGGNVYEWCEDWYDPSDPKSRVLRGGSWSAYGSGLLLSSGRGGDAPTDRYASFGFRCVLAVGSGG